MTSHKAVVFFLILHLLLFISQVQCFLFLDLLVKAKLLTALAAIPSALISTLMGGFIQPPPQQIIFVPIEQPLVPLLPTQTPIGGGTITVLPDGTLVFPQGQQRPMSQFAW